jgi:hypothetical protein
VVTRQTLLAWVSVIVALAAVVTGELYLNGRDERLPRQAAPVEIQTIRMMAPVGTWGERVNLKSPLITCEDFSRDVLLQGDDEHRTIVDGPTNRNWAGIVEGNNLRTIRFRARGDQSVEIVCHVYSVPPTRD